MHARLRLTSLALGLLCSSHLAPVFAAAAARPITAALQPFVDNHQLAGAVTLVATNATVVTIETVGFADVGAKTPMQTNTLFWIASQSKPMTAAAVMMLVDEGKLNLDDPVEKYLPEFKGQMVLAERDAEHMLLRKPGHPIKLREVLSHTSGLPFKSPLEEPTLDRLRLQDAVRSYAMLPLQSEPGAKYQYSNAGVNTAARVLEVVSGMPYEQFMQQRLFSPLGMSNTTFWPNPEQLGRLAKSYKPNTNGSGLEEIPITQLQYPLSDPSRQPVPAGGLFSTAQDVGRFCQMVLQGGMIDGKRVLSELAVQQMTSKQTGDSVPDRYGLGWSLGNGSFGHGGAYSTNMDIEPQRGLITVFLVQHAGFPGQSGSEIQKAFREGVGAALN